MYQSNEVSIFLKRFEAHVEPSTKRYTYKRPPYNYDLVFERTDRPVNIDLAREPCVELTLPPERFRDLVEQQEDLARLRHDSGRFGEMLADMREEERIRVDNPAVARAWRNYVLLLEMARK